MKHRSVDALCGAWMQAALRLKIKPDADDAGWQEDVILAVEAELHERDAKIIWCAPLGFHWEYSTSADEFEPIAPKVRRE